MVEQNNRVEPTEEGSLVFPIGICSHPRCAQARGLVIHTVNVLSSLCNTTTSAGLNQGEEYNQATHSVLGRRLRGDGRR